MAFTVQLQVNYSENNVIGKNISTISTVSGTLKNECSITDPIILLNADLSDYVNCNYCTIAVFNRSYFINDIVSIRNGLFEIHCHCDVLSTYSSQLLANKGIVKRSQTIYNRKLDDNSFKIYNDPIIQTLAFPNTMNDNRFILSIAGK